MFFFCYIIATLLGVWYRGCALVSKTKEMSSSLIAPAKIDTPRKQGLLSGRITLF